MDDLHVPAAGAGIRAEIEANLEAVRGHIREAAEAARRPADAVTLIAVSKAQPDERVRAALDLGVRVFGENYVQPAKARWPALREAHPDLDLHMIGAIQTNKVRDVVEVFDVIHTLDRPKLAAALAKEMAHQGRRLPCLVQVNTGEEEQKAGVIPTEADAFIQSCIDEHGLDVRGVMAIPPADGEAALHFALLAKIGARNRLPWLSMGMSADYATAIAFGATHVRVGSAVFGARPPKGS